MKKLMWLVIPAILSILICIPAYAIDSSYNADLAYNIDGWHVTAIDDDLSNAATLITDEDTAYAQNASAQTMEIVSSSTADTTQTVTIHGINASGNKIQESLLATGTTVAVTSKTFTYFDYAEIDKECAGTLTIQTVDNTDVTVIPIGALQSQVSQHFSGEKRSFITYWKCGVYSATAQVTFSLRWYPDDADCLDPTDGFILLDTIYISGAATSPYNAGGEYAQPIECPAGGMIAVYAIGSSDEGDGYTTLQGYDVD